MIVRVELATLLGGFVSTAPLAESRTYPVSSFEEVSVSAGISAVIGTGAVAVTADAANAAILDRLRIEVRGRRLEIGYTSGFFDSFCRPRAPARRSTLRSSSTPASTLSRH